VAATSGWSREGGTTITSAPRTPSTSRETLQLPSTEILRGNGYGGPRVLQPGQQLVIPRRVAQAQPPALAPAPATRAAAELPASVHVGQSRRHAHEPVAAATRRAAQIAAANTCRHRARSRRMKVSSPGQAAPPLRRGSRSRRGAEAPAPPAKPVTSPRRAAAEGARRDGSHDIPEASRR